MMTSARFVTRQTLLMALVLTAVTDVAAQALPDPTLLPQATTEQVPLTAAYDALGVPAKVAGEWYLDPTTAVKVHKLTSATFPVAGANWTHDYSEGGYEVSLPYTADGVTRAVLVRNEASGPYWLVDFTPGVGVSNVRPLTDEFAPNIELAFTFSNNPATPYYAYVGGVNGLRRLDLRTMTEAPGDGWPLLAETNAIWLHQSENDAFFVWMRGSSGGNMVGYEPATETLKTRLEPNADEPRIDRAGRYVGFSMNDPNNGLVVWDWLTDTIVWTTPGDPAGIPFAHNGSLRDRWIVSDFNSNRTFGMFTPGVPDSAQILPGPIPGSTAYVSGNWINYPASGDLDDQWALTYYYGGLRPADDGNLYLAPGGLVFMTPNGERRLLGHAYNTAGVYGYFSYGKSSADGQYVLMTSDMNGSGRTDLFLVEVPIAGTNPVPVIGSLTPSHAAAGGAGFTLTLDGAGFVAGSLVQWNGSVRATTVVDSTRLSAVIDATDIATVGAAAVTITSPGPGGGTSLALTFVIDLAPPGAASLIVPVASVATTTPTYTWAAVPGATQYLLWVDDSSGGRIRQTYSAAQAGCSDGTGTCSVTPNVTLNPGAGMWWIVSSNGAGSGPWSVGNAFTVDGVPPPPAAMLVAPSGSIVSASPTYTWNAAAGATQYLLWVDDASGGRIRTTYTAAQVGCVGGVGTCSISPSVILAPGNGRWWVVTGNASGSGPWSAMMTFTVAGTPPPPAATLIAPSGTIATASPTFTWNAAAAATEYLLWLDDASGGRIRQTYSALQAGCADGTGTCSITPVVVLTPGDGRWWIVTGNASGSGPWSSMMTFTVAGTPPPSAATPLAPSGSIASGSPAYTWNAVTGATQYLLWVDDSSGGRIRTTYTAAQAGCAAGIGICSITPNTALAPGAGRWWIVSGNATGNGPWSSMMTFTVAGSPPPGAATLLTPWGSSADTTPTYTWKAVATATQYLLWVDDSSGGRIRQTYTATETGCAGGTGTCAITPNVVLNAGGARWWIVTGNASGSGPWSAGATFTVP